MRSYSLIFIVLHDFGLGVALACDLVLVLVVLAPPCCFSRLFASISGIGLHDFGIGVAVVCDCFARVLKVLFVVVVAVAVAVAAAAVAVAVAAAAAVVVVGCWLTFQEGGGPD